MKNRPSPRGGMILKIVQIAEKKQNDGRKFARKIKVLILPKNGKKIIIMKIC